MQSRSGTIRYEMEGVQPTVDASDYFVISPNSGLITIAKSLASDITTVGSGKRPVYRVSAGRCVRSLCGRWGTVV